jgi:hypothetical protein
VKGVPYRLTRRLLIREALTQRTAPDDQWGAGWWLRPGEWEFGPFLPRTWRWAVTIKTLICILLGRSEDGSDWRIDRIIVAVFNGESRNGYPDEDYWSWDEVTIRKGLRPRTWWFAAGMETT